MSSVFCRHVAKQYPVNGGVFVDPLPLNETTCGLPVALSDIDSAPLTSPAPPGVKVTAIAHVAPGATLGMQLSASAKPAAAEILAKFSVMVP